MDDRHLDFRASLSVVARPSEWCVPRGHHGRLPSQHRRPLLLRSGAASRTACWSRAGRQPSPFGSTAVPRPAHPTRASAACIGRRAVRLACLSMLYGRGDDCSVLTGCSRAQDGASSALVMRGEAGVGKTALVDWVAHEAAQLGWPVLRCAGVASESDLAVRRRCTSCCGPRSRRCLPCARLHQEALNGALGLSGRRGVDPFLVGVAALSLLGELAGERRSPASSTTPSGSTPLRPTC